MRFSKAQMVMLIAVSLATLPLSGVSANGIANGNPYESVYTPSYGYQEVRAHYFSMHYGGIPTTRVEKGLVEGDLLVDDGLRLDGLVTGTVTVNASGILVVNGLVAQDVILTEGSSAIIGGIVVGNVCNRGGYLTVLGVIGGILFEESGSTDVDPHAIVKGGIRYREEPPSPTQIPTFENACFA